MRPSANRLAAFAGCFREILLELALFTIAFLCLGQRVFLGDDHGPQFGVFAVEFNPLLHVRLCIGADRVGGAFRFANAAVDAFIGMNDQHVFALIEAIHRTYFNAVSVFAGDTGIVNDIGHNIIFYGRFNAGDTSAQRIIQGGAPEKDQARGDHAYWGALFPQMPDFQVVFSRIGGPAGTDRCKAFAPRGPDHGGCRCHLSGSPAHRRPWQRAAR